MIFTCDSSPLAMLNVPVATASLSTSTVLAAELCEKRYSI